ncbi:MAG TPA: proton-conducting transporter membrane subunit [Nocardioidaceae bacterium]|nr:proton-conducting transporter membrane subunit [Nocardioidaceae bacterium]
MPDRFWPPFLFLWGGLNALFLAADVFNLYVTLELVSLAAVILVTLEGEGPALTAGMRYLLVAQVGALSYLLGVGFLYGGFGALDVALLGRLLAVEPDRVAVLALALMTAGLFVKTALFPVHVWLPPAHGAAPSPASALLSGLVVMASFYVLLRLWFDVFPGVATGAVRQLIGALGGASVLWGSLLALRQERLKLILAYSTVAQLGYLLLVFPLAGTVGAWAGGLYLALAHACAKAAMFLGAGLILQARGRDRLTDIRGAARHLPMTVVSLGLGGLTLMGLPPSGGFIGKWLLLTAAVESGQWWWAAVLLGGGILAVGYVFAVLRHAFTERGEEEEQEEGGFKPVPRWLEVVTLGLALVSVVLGFTGVPVVVLLTAAAP